MKLVLSDEAPVPSVIRAAVRAQRAVATNSGHGTSGTGAADGLSMTEPVMPQSAPQLATACARLIASGVALACGPGVSPARVPDDVGRWALWATQWTCGAALSGRDRARVADVAVLLASPRHSPPGVRDAAAGRTGIGGPASRNQGQEQDPTLSLMYWRPVVGAGDGAGGSGGWVPWLDETKERAPRVPLHAAVHGTAVVPTVDTRRHEALLQQLLRGGLPLVLCGPPGSGKTMTLEAVLSSMPGTDILGINFSSGTSVRDVLTALESRCEYRSTATGMVLQPKAAGSGEGDEEDATGKNGAGASDSSSS